MPVLVLFRRHHLLSLSLAGSACMAVAPALAQPVAKPTDPSTPVVASAARDGTVLAIGPNSAIKINEFAFDATTQQGNVLLDLLQGSVRVITGIIAKVNPEVFKVRTPTSVVGVRGTDFIVDTEAAR